MSKAKQRLMLFFFILMYVGLAVAGFGVAYYIKVSFFAPTQSTSQSAKQATVTPIPAPKGWKTYTNTDFKLSFSYPPTDAAQTKSYGFGVSSVSMNTTNGNLDFQILFLPKTLASAVGQDFDSYYAMPDKTTKVIKSPLSQDSTTDNFTKIHDRTVNGNQALDYQSIASNAKPGTPAEIGTFIEVGNNLVLISTGRTNKENLEKMLSSFHYQQ